MNCTPSGITNAVPRARPIQQHPIPSPPGQYPTPLPAGRRIDLQVGTRHHSTTGPRGAAILNADSHPLVERYVTPSPSVGLPFSFTVSTDCAARDLCKSQDHPSCSFCTAAPRAAKSETNRHHHHHHQPESYSGCCGTPPSVMRNDLVPHGSSIMHIGPSNHHASLGCGVDSYRLDTEVIRSSGKSMRWSRLGSINVHWPRSMPLGIASIRTHTL